MVPKSLMTLTGMHPIIVLLVILLINDLNLTPNKVLLQSLDGSLRCSTQTGDKRGYGMPSANLTVVSVKAISQPASRGLS